MSYVGISVKEAVNLINSPSNGWFLPSTQRPFVWGSRYESELYICKLFDSLLRGYPIGGLIIWKTEDKIPYREFMKDYQTRFIPKTVDKGLWKKPDKCLIYDGQQRLQTLFSCLRYTFNEKTLIFDLFFDMDKEEREMNETGFSFIGKNENTPIHSVRLNEIFCKDPEQDSDFESELLEINGNLTRTELTLVRRNIKKLWKVFVETDKKSLAFFPIEKKKEEEVNEVFQRLNMGGIPLSQADLLLSKIKESFYNFEENLQMFSRDIYNRTSNGYQFSHYEILQLIFLIHKGTIRIEPKYADTHADSKAMVKIWENLKSPLESFFVDFIWGQFKINNTAIVPRQRALLPIMVYFYEIHKKGIRFKNLSKEILVDLKQYFILSQINDWNLQSLVDNFARIVKVDADNSKYVFPFPLKKFIELLDESKKRETILYEARFIDYYWFSLKILTPNRVYQFDPDAAGRFSPEIDHIFPQKLEHQSNKYYETVNIIWNLQPVKGDINNYKRRKHPLEFFTKEGNKYMKDYNFLPTRDLASPIWTKPLQFINVRRAKMINFLKSEYELNLK